jgi:tetratricopeptide (TPR) repeat protein
MRIVKALVLSCSAIGITASSVGVAIALSSIVATSAYAAKADKQVGSKVGKPLKEALDLANSGKFKDAMSKAQEAAAIPGKTPVEDYKINEIMAYIAVKLGDYATAAKAYEATLQSGELPADQAKERLNQLTKMYYQLNNYPKVIQYGNQYLKEGGTDTMAALLVTQAYYQQKDDAHTIESAQALIRMANQSGQPVKEEWLQLLMNSQVRAGQENDALKTLDQLLDKFPTQQLWSQRLGYAQTHGASSDRKNLEMYRLKYIVGVLKDAEYVEMAQLSMALGFPGDAKTALEKGFNSKILGVGANKDRETRLYNLAQTSAATDQKGLPNFEKEAAAAAGGDSDVKLGEAYASYGSYDKAVEAIKRGLKKGNVKAEDEAHLQLGVAYANLKRNAEAISEFKAVPADSKLADVAHLWIIYVGNKS